MVNYRQYPKPRSDQIKEIGAQRIVTRTIDGKLNVNGTLTLTANGTTTTLTDFILDSASHIALMPMSANAAAALANVSFGSPTNGSVVLTHANNAQTDRTFRYSVIG